MEVVHTDDGVHGEEHTVSDAVPNQSAFSPAATVEAIVDAALAEALQRAAAASQWSTVEALTRELQARREARAGLGDISRARGGR